MCFPTFLRNRLICRDRLFLQTFINAYSTSISGMRSHTCRIWPYACFVLIHFYISYEFSGQGSSVGIATGYGLDGRGIESRWERDFPHLSRPALRSTQPPVQWVPRLSRGQRGAGA